MSREYTPTTNGLRNRYLWWYEAQRERQPSKFAKYPDQVLAEFDRWLAEHDREVLANARVRAEFTEYMPNDGEYEYMSDSDCDGSNVRYFRRRPRYEGSYHPWEQTTAEAHAAAVHCEVEGDR